jgi:hypothetical protein
MVDRIIIEERDTFVGEIAPIVLKEGGMTEATANMIITAIQSIIRKINGKLSFGTGETGHKAGNLDAQFIDLITPPVANAEFIVPHGLKRLPVGWIVVRKDINGYPLYDSSNGSWNDQLMYFKSNTANAAFRILVF